MPYPNGCYRPEHARQPAPDGKVYFSYADIHHAIGTVVPAVREWKPDLIIAIGGGGYIPARMLRTELKIPMLAVSLELYNDATDSMNDQVKKIQWFDAESGVAQDIGNKRVLIVDEVDDTRTTLRYCVDEVRNTNAPAAIAVAVVHNKLKPKRAELPEDVAYFVGEEVPDRWNCYPWDAAKYGRDIGAHEALAARCSAGAAAEETKKNDEGAASVTAAGADDVESSAASASPTSELLVRAATAAGLLLAGVALGRAVASRSPSAPSVAA